MIRIDAENLVEDEHEQLLYLLNGTPFTGIAYGLWDDDQIQFEIEYTDGVPTGHVWRWYQSGQLEYVSYNIYADRIRLFHTWFQNGQLKEELVKENHIRIMQKIWDETGNLTYSYEISESEPEYKHLIYRRQNWV